MMTEMKYLTGSPLNYRGVGGLSSALGNHSDSVSDSVLIKDSTGETETYKLACTSKMAGKIYI